MADIQPLHVSTQDERITQLAKDASVPVVLIRALTLKVGGVTARSLRITKFDQALRALARQREIEVTHEEVGTGENVENF